MPAKWRAESFYFPSVAVVPDCPHWFLLQNAILLNCKKWCPGLETSAVVFAQSCPHIVFGRAHRSPGRSPWNIKSWYNIRYGFTRLVKQTSLIRGIPNKTYAHKLTKGLNDSLFAQKKNNAIKWRGKKQTRASLHVTNKIPAGSLVDNSALFSTKIYSKCQHCSPPLFFQSWGRDK